MKSSLVCNHTNDQQNRRSRSRGPILLITKSCYQLIKTMTKSEKQNNHRLNVLMNQKRNSCLFFNGSARENEPSSLQRVQMTRTVRLHWHEA